MCGTTPPGGYPTAPSGGKEAGRPKRAPPLSVPASRAILPLELEDDAGLSAARAAAAPEQEPEYQPAAQDDEPRPRGQERDEGALGGGGGGPLLDLFGRRRPLDDLFEVLQVLLHHDLGIRDEPRGDLARLAARGVPVVHLDLYSRAARGHLPKAHLARGLDLAALGVPADGPVLLVLSGLSVELQAGA